MTYRQTYLSSPHLRHDLLVFITDDDLWKVELGDQSLKQLTWGRKTWDRKKQNIPPLTAIRLTTSSGISGPTIAPDRQHIAYLSKEAGELNAYVISRYGGLPKRLSYKGHVNIVGWSPAGHLLLMGGYRKPYSTGPMYEISLSGEEISQRYLGPLDFYDHSEHGEVIGRDLGSLRNWKKYQGGRIGKIWVHCSRGANKNSSNKVKNLQKTPPATASSASASSFVRRVLHGRSNIGSLAVSGEHIYYTTDAEGIGNVYRTSFKGSSSESISSQKDHYVEGFSVSGEYLVYSAGGDLFAQNISDKKATQLPIAVTSSFDQLQRRYFSAYDHLHDYAVNHHGSWVALVVRGGLYVMKPWAGGVTQLDVEREWQRFRLIHGFGKGRDFLTVGVNDRGEDRLLWCRWQEKTQQYKLKLLSDEDRGKISAIKSSDDQKSIVVTTTRHQIWHIAWSSSSSKFTLVDHSNLSIEGFDLSPDSTYIAYEKEFCDDPSIWVYHIPSSKKRQLIRSYGHDSCPSFDRSEPLLYFLSKRTFIPGEDDGALGQSFYGNLQPYVVHLTKETTSFKSRALELDSSDQEPGEGSNDDSEESSDGNDSKQKPSSQPGKLQDTQEKDPKKDLKNMTKEEDKEKKATGSKKTSTKSSKKSQKTKSSSDESSKEDQDKKKSKNKGSGNKQKGKKLTIDFDDIDHRIEPLTFARGGWRDIICQKDHIFILRGSPSHISESGLSNPSKSQGHRIYSYHKQSGQKSEHGSALSITFSGDGKYILYHSESGGLGLTSSSDKNIGGLSSDDKMSPRPKSLDLSRIRRSVEPRQEWDQILVEALYLLLSNFYNADHDYDFSTLLAQYRPQIEKISTRRELSMLIWDMQGSVNTSHCYEVSGDYPKRHHYLPVAKIGAEVIFLPSKKCFRIKRLLRGESWEMSSRSPLLAPGVGLKEGDEIYSMDGRGFTSNTDLERYLDHHSGTNLELSVKRKGRKAREDVVVTTSSTFSLAYYDWCHTNRQRVRELSGDAIGYLHIPDMSPWSVGHFYKHFAVEKNYQALIIDVRNNGGGHVSGVIISHLITKSLGECRVRWGHNTLPYPDHSAPKHLVCLVNEGSASDGDIFPHAFRLSGLGPVIGTRTWGGTVGMWPQISLVDGTITTQPQFENVFGDDQQTLENIGVEPDITVEITPDDYRLGRDPQLERGVDWLLEALDSNKREKGNESNDKGAPESSKTSTNTVVDRSNSKVTSTKKSSKSKKTTKQEFKNATKETPSQKSTKTKNKSGSLSKTKPSQRKKK